MREVPESELRFLLKRGLQQLPRSILRDMGGPADKREAALEQAVEVMAERFKRLVIQAPDVPETPSERGVG